MFALEWEQVVWPNSEYLRWIIWSLTQFSDSFRSGFCGSKNVKIGKPFPVLCSIMLRVSSWWIRSLLSFWDFFLLLPSTSIFTHFLCLVQAFICCYLGFCNSTVIIFLIPVFALPYMPFSLPSEITLRSVMIIMPSLFPSTLISSLLSIIWSKVKLTCSPLAMYIVFLPYQNTKLILKLSGFLVFDILLYQVRIHL